MIPNRSTFSSCDKLLKFLENYPNMFEVEAFDKIEDLDTATDIEWNKCDISNLKDPCAQVRIKLLGPNENIANADTAMSFDFLSPVDASDVAVSSCCADTCTSKGSIALSGLSSSSSPLSTSLPSSSLPSSSSSIPSSSSSSSSSTLLSTTFPSPSSSPACLTFPAEPNVSFSFIPPFGTMRTIIKTDHTQVGSNFDRKIPSMIGISGFEYTYGQKNVTLSQDYEDDDAVVFYDDWLNPLDKDSLDTLTSRSVALTSVIALTGRAAGLAASGSTMSTSLDSSISTSVESVSAIKSNDQNPRSYLLPTCTTPMSTLSSLSTKLSSSTSDTSPPLSLMSNSSGTPSDSLDDDTIRRLKLIRYKNKMNRLEEHGTNDREESQKMDLLLYPNDQNDGVDTDVDADTIRTAQANDLVDVLLTTTAPRDIATSSPSFADLLQSFQLIKR